MEIFVSYTVRDGVFDRTSLEQISAVVTSAGHCSYVDLLHNRAATPQRYVVERLKACDIVLACVTPYYLLSPWVRLELAAAATYGIPVVRWVESTELVGLSAIVAPVARA